MINNQKHDRSIKSHATNIGITSTTRHQKRFSTSNTKVKARTMPPWSQEVIRAAWRLLGWNPRIRGGGAPRIIVARRDDVLLYECHRVHIYSPETWKQSKQTCPNRTLSLIQTELSLKIHDPHGPDTHAGADSQAFFNSCFKPNSLAAH